jgi:hypothetical protein
MLLSFSASCQDLSEMKGKYRLAIRPVLGEETGNEEKLRNG